MLNLPLIEQTLIRPILSGAQELLIISGYATPTMASWHMTKIRELNLPPVRIKLIVGMTNFDGLTIDVHEGFKQLATAELKSGLSEFQCQYIFQGAPVHSKLYIWMRNDEPAEAYTGSANYTQAGFSLGRREYIVPCDAHNAFE
ncbi:MAG: restriction endonuclease PLD domain-containing protein, partial [Candidatus Kryptoniota bacterium]